MSNQILGAIGALSLSSADRRGSQPTTFFETMIARPESLIQDLHFQESAHELRTTMNAIMDMGQLLQNTDMTDQQSAFIDTIMASSHQLLLLINELVDNEKIKSGALQLSPDPCDLRKSTTKVHARLSAMAETRHIRIVCLFEEKAKNWYHLDAERFEQITFNIGRHILNQMKTSEILLYAGMTKKNELSIKISFNEATAPISGSSAGPLTPSASSDELGLVIARALLSLMGAELITQTDETGRRVFEFHLMVEAVTAPPPQADTSSPTDTAFTPRRPFNILIVEDNVTNWDMLREALASNHVRIHETAFAWHAEQILANQDSIDIILLDLKLPDENGVQILHRTRISSEHYANIPVIVLTATRDETKLKPIRALNVKAIITKPVPLYQIFRPLNSLSDAPLGARIDVHDVIS